MKALLLVDDDRSVLGFVSQAARDHGVPVLCAGSGRDALRTLAAFDDIGLVVSGIELPGMSGVELCARMQEDEKLKAVPVVLMTTGHGARPDGNRCVLRKPLSYVQVQCLITVHLGGACPAGKTQRCKEASAAACPRSHVGVGPERAVETCPDPCEHCPGAIAT
jgi:CheY-like chemotaxis protein